MSETILIKALEIVEAITAEVIVMVVEDTDRTIDIETTLIIDVVGITVEESVDSDQKLG